MIELLTETRFSLLDVIAGAVLVEVIVWFNSKRKDKESK